MEYDVEFKVDWKNDVVMNIVSNNQIIFSEKVTDKVLNAALELSSNRVE